MSALNFLISGGFAKLDGDLSEAECRLIDDIAREFGASVRAFARENQIPASRLDVFSAPLLLTCKDAESYHFIFAGQPGWQTTSIEYRHIVGCGAVSIDQIVAEERLNIGEPTFGFTVPLGSAQQANRAEMIANATRAYMLKLQNAMTQASTPDHVVDPKLCFVIMSFSNDSRLLDFYEQGIKPTIEALGYCCERVDEQQFNGSIRTRILQNIASAKFIVADVTQARPNCYYELGIAHAMGKEVVHLTSKTDDVHFDIKDFNFIVYQRIVDLKDKLEKRLLETVGKAE